MLKEPSFNVVTVPSTELLMAFENDEYTISTSWAPLVIKLSGVDMTASRLDAFTTLVAASLLAATICAELSAANAMAMPFLLR